MRSSKPIITARSVGKVYQRGVERVEALREVSFDILPGEFVAIVGPSGSGKTTLLNLIGCMDVPTSGKLCIMADSVGEASEKELTRLRREWIGFVFQHFGLLPTLTVAENIALPTLFSRKVSSQRVSDLLRLVGLEHRAHHRPHQLSGGEMQRVAIARALVNEPPILLADEPTGNLDSATGQTILELFRTLQKGGITVVVVTHNEGLASAADRQIVLQDGRVRRE